MIRELLEDERKAKKCPLCGISLKSKLHKELHFEAHKLPINGSPSSKEQKRLKEEVKAIKESIMAIEILRKGNAEGLKCRVLWTEPDGDCGFSNMRQLKSGVHIKANLPTSRNEFINLVTEQYSNSGEGSEIQNSIVKFLRLDLDLEQAEQLPSNVIAQWQGKFSSKGYWMEDSHMEFLAHACGVQFHIYKINDGCFQHQMAVGSRNNRENIHIGFVPLTIEGVEVHYVALIIDTSTSDEKVFRLEDTKDDDEEQHQPPGTNRKRRSRSRNTEDSSSSSRRSRSSKKQKYSSHQERGSRKRSVSSDRTDVSAGKRTKKHDDTDSDDILDDFDMDD